MINTLSILIPTYNNVCLELVKSLQAQASLLSSSSETRSSSPESFSRFEYEILVADDGSTDKGTVEENRIINTLPHCRYIEREKNVGRAAIRNFLAQEAKYPWLLFIDSNMNVISQQYLANYQKEKENDVIYGGYQIKRDAETRERLKYNLRYIFESAGTQNGNHLQRQANPYADFHTSNFIVKRNIILRYPFDERFIHYGYEDVLWGKNLKDNHISILHVDNPLGYEHVVYPQDRGKPSYTLSIQKRIGRIFQNHQLCRQAEALPSLSALPASLSAAESANKSKAHRQ